MLWKLFLGVKKVNNLLILTNFFNTEGLRNFLKNKLRKRQLIFCTFGRKVTVRHNLGLVFDLEFIFFFLILAEDFVQTVVNTAIKLLNNCGMHPSLFEKFDRICKSRTDLFYQNSSSCHVLRILSTQNQRKLGDMPKKKTEIVV